VKNINSLHEIMVVRWFFENELIKQDALCKNVPFRNAAKKMPFECRLTLLACMLID
jgi:hypothetical protein